ncbi:type IV secretory system conjugative DNA transfer family protein [Glutamicibacter arilaitensis]|uniref:ATP-binding protein n=1 Tax=Glutamicibacter arilaitensis TaxID=256701 RepID=A0A4Y8TXY6_9MICC|nr:type IV secretion system DNA-binding domain-containing protein [Glutamicibacter arilaitensis]TFH57035.1 ATP-binding protein [Glutamicibacter arilaitensis]
MSRSPKYRQRTELVWFTIFWARPLLNEQAVGALQHLASLTHAPQIILETRATSQGIEYLAATNRQFEPALRRTIEQLVPGTVITATEDDRRKSVSTARKVIYSAPQQSLDISDNEASVRGVLASLTGLRGKETAVIQIVLGHRYAPKPAFQQLAKRTAPQTALKHVQVKAEAFGFGAIIRIGVTASSPDRRKRMTTSILSALRAALSPGLELRLAPERSGVINNPANTWPLFPGSTKLSINEVTLMTAWPLGDPNQPYPGLPALHPALIRPSFVAKTGDRIMATSTAPGCEAQRLGISEMDSRRHTWVMGPTGTGKSSLLLNLIRQDMEVGRPVIVIEPKDLVADVLTQVPDHRKDDVVLLDPLDDTPTGFNPLDLAGRSPALVADQLFSFFAAVYGKDVLGPRSADILRLALDAVAHAENPTLAMLPLLLTNPGFRHKLTAPRIAADPLHAAPFWQWYESLSPDARAQAIAPLQNKLRLFLQEPLRSVLAQPSPRFNLRDAVSGNKILLVPLHSGTLGSEAASLLGSLVISELWEALKERVRVPERLRRTVMIYLDEAQMYLERFPVDIADALAMSRSLGAAFHLSHQYTDQLSSKLLRGFEANCRNKIFFQLAGHDATYASRLSPGLAPEDFTALPSRHIYAQLVRDGAVTDWSSGRTVDTPQRTSDPAKIIAASRKAYGQSRAAVEAQLRSLVTPITPPHAESPEHAGKRQRRTP